VQPAVQGRDGPGVLEQVSAVPEPSFAVEAETALLANFAQQIGVHATILDGRAGLRARPNYLRTGAIWSQADGRRSDAGSSA